VEKGVEGRRDTAVRMTNGSCFIYEVFWRTTSLLQRVREWSRRDEEREERERERERESAMGMAARLVEITAARRRRK
jgi:hypothetical protein